MLKEKFEETFKQFFIYLIVGGLATIVEWVAFYGLNYKVGINYMVATALAFVVSTFANWAFGRLLLFHGKYNIFKELARIYAASIIGLLINLCIMWVGVNKIMLPAMIAKVIATGVAFFWNFIIRKFFIYKKQ